MIVSTLKQIIGSSRDVAWGHGRSRRFLLKKDAKKRHLGASLSPILWSKKASTSYCNTKIIWKPAISSISEGQLTNEASGEKYNIAPGLFYALDNNDRHRVEAYSNLRMLCVFSPALEGNEKHSHKDKDSIGDSSY